MENQSTFWRTAMTYGLYLGIVLVFYSVILYVLGENFNTTLSLFSYIIMVVGIYYAQRNYRNIELNGFINYSKALGFGISVMLFAGIISALYSVILMTFIDTTLIDQMKIMQEEIWIGMGYTDSQVEMMADSLSFFYKPLWLGISALFGSALIGLIISLITSIFVKKQDDEDAFEDAMSEIKSDE